MQPFLFLVKPALLLLMPSPGCCTNNLVSLAVIAPNLKESSPASHVLLLQDKLVVEP